MSPNPSLKSDTPSKRPPTPAKDLEYGVTQAAHQADDRATSPTPSKRSNADDNLPWNQSHPCYPHPNPHIALSNPLHNTTRIIRIPRDWMIAGDLAPTFSNTYPEILEPWVREADFRLLIKGVNERLIAAFSPYSWRAWLDLVLGVLTGWLWEDFGFAAVKSGCRDVENFIQGWNVDSRAGMDKDEADLVRVIPLRRTGYLCLDIQIPDPQVGVVESKPGSARGGEREGS